MMVCYMAKVRKAEKTKADLTFKQQRFIDFYNGNATQAAEKAGYKQARASGHELITKPNILKAIRNREVKRTKSTIATREERQEFWTKVANGEIKDQISKTDGEGNVTVIDKPSRMSDRLKASELLGRSEADFTDNQRISGAGGKDLVWITEIVRSEVKG